MAQEYILRYGDELKGLVFSGSAAQNGLQVFARRLISSVQIALFGDEKQSKLMDRLSFMIRND